jgi:hypothetical protein
LLIPSSYQKYLQKSSLAVVHEAVICVFREFCISVIFSSEYKRERFGLNDSFFHHIKFEIDTFISASEIFLINQGPVVIINHKAMTQRVASICFNNFLDILNKPHQIQAIPIKNIE